MKTRTMSPTARTLARLRTAGALAGVVERWNAHAKVRQDFLGFADILAVEPDQCGVLAVQACTIGDQRKRYAKITTPPVRSRARAWLEAGNRIEIHGWALRGAAGTRKLYECRITMVTLADVGDSAAEKGGA